MSSMIGNDSCLPRYAWPTFASSTRQTCKTNNPPNPSSRLSLLHPPSPAASSAQRHEAARGYSAATAASQRKESRWKPFRLLDLPGEIRNLVYEELTVYDIVHGCMFPKLFAVDLTNPYLQHPMDALPTMLRICRQITSEVGGYFFKPDQGLTILVNASRMTAFRTWLNNIGRLNRERLAKNRCVHLVFPKCRLTDHTSNDSCTKQLSFYDAALVTHLDGVSADCMESFPQLQHWRFSVTSLTALDDWRARYYCTTAPLELPILISDLRRMRHTMLHVVESLNRGKRINTARETWLKIKGKTKQYVIVQGADQALWKLGHPSSKY